MILKCRFMSLVFLKAIAMLPPGSVSFPSHALIPGPRSLHVNGDDEIGERQDREEG